MNSGVNTWMKHQGSPSFRDVPKPKNLVHEHVRTRTHTQNPVEFQEYKKISLEKFFFAKNL